ncbi:kinase-like protein [Auricularia subglabra TFB-10046 SS5]|nr:kinase-like protein [Auricularia subglabra TFB-10046 SS5]
MNAPSGSNGDAEVRLDGPERRGDNVKQPGERVVDRAAHDVWKGWIDLARKSPSHGRGHFKKPMAIDTEPVDKHSGNGDVSDVGVGRKPQRGGAGLEMTMYNPPPAPSACAGENQDDGHLTSGALGALGCCPGQRSAERENGDNRSKTCLGPTTLRARTRAEADFMPASSLDAATKAAQAGPAMSLHISSGVTSASSDPHGDDCDGSRDVDAGDDASSMSSGSDGGASSTSSGTVDTEVDGPEGHMEIATRGLYVMHERLGSGGSATVYRATHISSGTPCAVKLLNPAFRPRRPALGGKHLQWKGTKTDESALLHKLSHANVIRIFESQSAGGHTWMVLELLGPDLQTVIDTGGGFDEPRAKGLARDLASGLEYLHSSGIIHRDLKPPNVLFTDALATRAKLADFGLSATADSDGMTIVRGAMSRIA